LLVLAPELLRCFDVGLLALLGSTGQQNDHRIAVLAELDRVTWAKVEPEFHYARANVFRCSTAAAEPVERDSDARSRSVFELQVPALEGITALGGRCTAEIPSPALVAQKIP